MAVLGIDLGTSSCKTILVDSSGKVLKQSCHAYPLSTPKPFWSEQNPLDWWNALVASVREIVSFSSVEIKGIGLTGQMHGLVVLDNETQVLRPAILWNDGRAQEEAELLCERVPHFLQEIGNYPLVGHPAPKMLWLQRHEPEIWAKVAKLCLPKDYLRFRLTGEWVTDMSDGSGMLLMNVEKRAWSQPMLEACGVSEEAIGRVVEGSEISAYLSREAAEILGLKAGIPIVGGAGDQPAAAIGAGCIKPLQTMISLGTSGVVLAMTNKYKKNARPAINSFCHALPNTWFHMGVMLSAAGSLQWYRDTCAVNMGFEALCHSAKEIPVGCDDLIFLPYLTGERTPHTDPYLRGGFVGLTRRHEQAYLTRAVLEGIGFGLYDSIQLIEEGGIPIKEATVTGMGTQSGVWMQMLADIFNIRLIQTENAEYGPALGAARLALVGCCSTTLEDICSLSKIIQEFVPNAFVHAQYQPVIKRFRSLYPVLEAYFKAPYGVKPTNKVKKVASSARELA